MLAHAAGVDENKRGGAVVDDGQHFMRQLDAQVPGPGIFFNFVGQDGFDLDLLFRRARQ
jgi:hypothetical protein